MSINATNTTITVVGLGPGRRGALTVDALDALRRAHRLFLDALTRAILDEIRGDLPPDAEIHSLDTAPSYGDAAISAQLLAAAMHGSLTYAVRGHPLLDHRAMQVLIGEAAERGIQVEIVGGLSLLDTARATIPPDEQARGLQIISAHGLMASDAAGSDETRLQARWTGTSSRLLNAQASLLVAPLSDADMLAAVARRLGERYPADHGIVVISLAASGQQTIYARLDSLGDESAIQARRDDLSLPYALYVPPLVPLDDARSPNTLGYITARLRAPDGCPWDREQTHLSLTPYMIEEAYEAIDAIERGDEIDMVEELGDVLLQVVLHSQLAEEEGRFSLADVAEEVNRKLVRRHPHVFGDVEVSGSSEVLRNWERIKRAEKGERRASALDGIPTALPALALAQTMGRKAAKLGFDWPNVEGVVEKVREELDELQSAAGEAERYDEMGDLLFALSSICRHMEINAEEALRAAARKFGDRFRRVEALAQLRALDLATLDAAQLDALWDEAKRAT